MPNPGRGSSDDPADDPQESPTVIEPVADPTVIPGHPPADESPTVYEPIDRLSLRKSMQNPTEQVAPPTSAGPTSVGPTAVEHTSLGPAAPYRATQVNPSTPFPALGPLPAGPPPAGPPPAGPPYGPPPGMPPGYQGGPPMPPAPPRRKRSRAPWIVSGVVLVLVAALVAGGVVWWQHRSSDDDDQPALLAGQLTGSYPTAPSAPQWTVKPSDFGGDRFVSPLPWDKQYQRPGAIHDDTTLVTLVGDSSTGYADLNPLVGVNTHTGRHWTFGKRVAQCADTVADNAVACADTSTVYVIDVRTGESTTTMPLPSGGYGLAFNGSAVFTRSFLEGHNSVVISKLSPTGTQWQREVAVPEPLPSGDSSGFTATKHLVATGSGTVVVVSADDGRTILAKPGRADIGKLPDGSMTVITGNTDGGNPTDGPVVHVRPDGTTQSLGGKTFSVPGVVTAGQRDRIMVGRSYTSVNDGTAVWSVQSDNEYASPEVYVADDREVVVSGLGNGSLGAVDTANGRVIWTASDVGEVVTDGEHLIGASTDGGLTAIDLETGSRLWSVDAATLGNRAIGGQSTPSAPQVLVGGGTLATFTAATIAAFAPTGPRAIVPGTTRKQSTDNGNGSGGTEYVTPCGSPPKFTPQSFRTSSGGLGVTMKVSATCPGGDILWGPQTRITIKDGNDLVASGNFDFSQTPVAVPSLDDAGTGLTMELTYPPGSFYRLPDTLSTQASTDRFLVDCDKGPTTGQPPKLTVPDEGSAATTATATGPSLPPGTDLTAASVDALRVQANSDRAFILTNLNNRWVAQLSSKRPGLNAEGRIWDNQAILDEFLALRLRFSDVRLLYSDEWPVFNYRGWWVTVAAATFPGPDAANNWCRAQGFTKDHCFAKLISSTQGPEGSTRYWS